MTSPICSKFACRADQSLGIIPLDGSVHSVVVQTTGAGDDQTHTMCASGTGGQQGVAGANGTAPVAGTAPAVTPATTPTSSVKATTKKKKKHHKKHLVKPKRHKRTKKRSVSGVAVTAPAFTG